MVWWAGIEFISAAAALVLHQAHPSRQHEVCSALAEVSLVVDRQSSAKLERWKDVPSRASRIPRAGWLVSEMRQRGAAAVMLDWPLR